MSHESSAELWQLPFDLTRSRGTKNMSNNKTFPENKSYHDGIYIYFMNQKLLKAKNSKQTPSK